VEHERGRDIHLRIRLPGIPLILDLRTEHKEVEGTVCMKDVLHGVLWRVLARRDGRLLYAAVHGCRGRDRSWSSQGLRGHDDDDDRKEWLSGGVVGHHSTIETGSRACSRLDHASEECE
jgi:hypothetical protein